MIFETKEVFNELVSERYDEILELSKKNNFNYSVF